MSESPHAAESDAPRWKAHRRKMAAGYFDGPHAESDAGPIHFWHPDLLSALHAFAQPFEAVFTDDLRDVNCDACQSEMVAAVRSQRALRAADAPTRGRWLHAHLRSCAVQAWFQSGSSDAPPDCTCEETSVTSPGE